MKNKISTIKGKFYFSSLALHLVLATAFALAVSQSESLQETFTEISEFQLVNSGQKTGKGFTKTGTAVSATALPENSKASPDVLQNQEAVPRLDEMVETHQQNLSDKGSATAGYQSADGVAVGVVDMSDSAQVGSLLAKPKVIKEVKAQYPVEAKSARLQGVVSMQVWVDEQGQVVKVDVLEGPAEPLNEAAKSALMQFRFTPAMTAQGPRKFKLNYKYRFKLENQ